MTTHAGLKMGFGLTLEGKLVDIHKAENGLKCGLVCPGCKTEVLAKQGILKRWHFAHHGLDCSNYADAVLKLLAKETLKEKLFINLPNALIVKPKTIGKSFFHLVFKGLPISFKNKAVFDTDPDFSLCNDYLFEFERIDFDVEFLDGFVADAVIYSKDGKNKFILEITTKSNINPERLECLKQLGFSCLHLDLTDFKKQLQKTGNFNSDDLKNFVTRDASFISKWIKNDKLAKQHSDIIENFNQQIKTKRVYAVYNSKFAKSKVYSCPKLLKGHEPITLMECVGDCEQFYSVEQTSEQNGWKLNCLGCSEFKRI